MADVKPMLAAGAAAAKTPDTSYVPDTDTEINLIEGGWDFNLAQPGVEGFQVFTRPWATHPSASNGNEIVSRHYSPLGDIAQGNRVKGKTGTLKIWLLGIPGGCNITTGIIHTDPKWGDGGRMMGSYALYPQSVTGASIKPIAKFVDITSGIVGDTGTAITVGVLGEKDEKAIALDAVSADSDEKTIKKHDFLMDITPIGTLTGAKGTVPLSKLAVFGIEVTLGSVVKKHEELPFNIIMAIRAEKIDYPAAFH